jgi:AcrR family transcriptional regulator
MSTPQEANRLVPRKTPRQQRAQATVAAIVEAAAHILEEKGLDAYTTNAVAARAGVSIGSVYQYFPNRDSVTRALIERRSEALLTAILQIDPAAMGRDGLQHVIQIAVAQQLREANLSRILDLEEARMPASEALRSQGKRASQVIRAYLDQSKVLAGDLDTVAGDIMAITLGMVDAAGRRGERDEEALTRRVVRAVFGYLDGPPD